MGSSTSSLCAAKGNISEPYEEVYAHPRLLASQAAGTSKQVKEGGLSREMFIIARNSSCIEQHYSLDKELIGEGSYASVSLGRSKATGRCCAIKAIARETPKDFEDFRKEVQIMKLMDHPGIAQLYETFEDQKNLYLVMEVCMGGELLQKMMSVHTFTERQAAILMRQAIRAVRHMHEHRVCHRDLKPENFLFLNKNPIKTNILKIIDFGCSTRFEDGKFLKTKVGTPYCVAPEVFSGRYNQAVDLWSCGVIMYALLCGYPPFYGSNEMEILSNVKQGAVPFTPKDWKHVSLGAQDLIKNLLKMEPELRYTAEQALNDDWIKREAPKVAGVSLKAGLLDHLRSFQAASHLKKAALTVIAGRLSEQQLGGLREAFVAMDVNCDGLLSMSEVRDGLAKAGLSELPQDFQKLMDDVDADGSGRIDYTEFLAAMLDKRLYLQENAVREAFNVFDLNRDGQISPEELKLVLCDDRVQETTGARKVEDLMHQVDNNGDGMIDFEEFMAMMHQDCSPSHNHK